MRIGGLFCVLVLGVACGQSLKPGKTPTETVRRTEKALRDLNLAAVYDMMSTRCQQQMDQMLGGVRTLLASIPDAQLDQAGLGDLRDMTARELIEAAVDRAKDEAPGSLKQIETLQIAILEVRNYGDRATVKTMMLLNGRQVPNDVPLVLEDGRWRLDADDSLTNLPVSFTPDVQACFGPT